MNYPDAMDNKPLQMTYQCQKPQIIHNLQKTLEKRLESYLLQDKDEILSSITTLNNVLMDHTGSTPNREKLKESLLF